MFLYREGHGQVHGCTSVAGGMDRYTDVLVSREGMDARSDRPRVIQKDPIFFLLFLSHEIDVCIYSVDAFHIKNSR